MGGVPAGRSGGPNACPEALAEAALERGQDPAKKPPPPEKKQREVVGQGERADAPRRARNLDVGVAEP